MVCYQSQPFLQRRLRVRHEDKQFFDMTLNPAAELALDRQRVFHEWTAQRQQPRFQDQLPL